MQLLILLSLALGTLHLILLSAVLFRAWVNPMSLYCGIWGLAHIAHQMRLLPYPPLSRVGVTAFAIGHLGFLLGTMAPVLLRQSVGQHLHKPPRDAVWPTQLSERALRRTLMLFAPFQVAAVGARLFLFLQLAQVSIGEMIADPLAARMAMVASERSGEETGFILLLRGIDVSLGFSILLGVVVAGIHLATAKRKTIWVYVTLMNGVLQSLVSLQRAQAVYNILLTGFAFVLARQFVHRGRLRLPLSMILKLSLVVVIVVGVLFAVIDRQLSKSDPWRTQTDLNPAITSLYFYFSGAITGFDRYLEVYGRQSAMYGVSTFYVMVKWLIRLGVLDPTMRRSPFRDFLTLWYPVRRNTFTWFVNFYEDFKLWGVFALPFILGTLSTVAYILIRRRFTLTRTIVNTILWLAIIWSFYGYRLNSTQQFSVLAIVYLFDSLVLKPGLLVRKWRFVKGFSS
jgi:oligosaccharide repeat unit polymerase